MGLGESFPGSFFNHSKAVQVLRYDFTRIVKALLQVTARVHRPES